MQTRDYVWIRDEGRCIYCGDLGQEFDHVIPQDQKGPNHSGNLVVACRSCNHKKRGLALDYIIKAFQHLARKGESLEWADEFAIGSFEPRIIQSSAAKARAEYVAKRRQLLRETVARYKQRDTGAAGQSEPSPKANDT